MDCIIKEVVTLEKSGVCPFSGQKCDGTLSLNWSKDYVLIPESKACLSRGQKAVFIEASRADLEAVGKDSAVLMLQANGTKVFLKVSE